MKNKIKILLVEDDVNLGFMLVEYLEANGFNVKLYRDGESGLNAYLNDKYDFCILDLMLPKMDGFQLAEKIRADEKKVPIIMLTARSMPEDKVKGFKVGIDDYVTKPFNEEVLVCRINAILERAGEVKQPEFKTEYCIGEYKLICKTQSLKGPEEERRLTQKESAILKILCHKPNEIVPRSDIMISVWGNDDYFIGRSLDVFVSKLRKYLKADPKLSIESIPSVGLILNTQG